MFNKNSKQMMLRAISILGVLDVSDAESSSDFFKQGVPIVATLAVIPVAFFLVCCITAACRKKESSNRERTPLLLIANPVYGGALPSNDALDSGVSFLA